MEANIKALEANNTWKIMDLPPRKMPIGCRWVYKTKRNVDGHIEHYKEWVVAKGYTQHEGIDYLDTYSPMARLTTVQIVLIVATIKNWFLE